MDSKMMKGTYYWLGVDVLRSAIRLIVMVVLLGYLMVWIMMPTNMFWLHWLPDIHAKTDSKFFGQQGANLLIYTFPILLVATLGCVYLHLGKECVDHDGAENSRWALWKRPVLVKGPLGIVSWIELSFLSMFFILLVWSISASLHGMFENITHQSAAKMGVKVWEAKLESAGLMLSLVGNICLAFLFFPVTRGSSVLRIIGLTSESSIKYHIWLGHIAMTLFTAHGLCYIIFWAGLNYAPTSTLFVNVPSISKLQWHPFTITSNSNTDPLIKMEKIWCRHDMLVMVSGGSGMTPFISIIRELIFRANGISSKSPRVLLICAFKKSLDVTMLDLILPHSGTTSDISPLQLQIEVYITRETKPTRDNQKLLRTIQFNFKPSSSDVPVSAILGSNSWLWLGAIISSSFVLFLLIISILTRYQIEPIDHNTNMIYSYSARSSLNMLFICLSIAMTATAAFLWNKDQAAKEMKQIQNMDAPTPTRSPGSWFHNADGELEAFPHRSFVEATKVHYGERPNHVKELKHYLLRSPSI